MRLAALSMRDVSIALIAVVTAAVIYVLCRVVNDWLNEEPGLPLEARIAVAGVLSILLWYGVQCIQNSLGTLRTCGRATVRLVPLFLLLLALLFRQASKY
jgi:uncharacterized membrane-anchored protein